MKKAFIVLLIIGMVFISACSAKNDTNINNDNQNQVANAKQTQNQGYLDPVEIEYTFCHGTDSYDPTESIACIENLSYKECVQTVKDWQNVEIQLRGTPSTSFTAHFNGGTPKQGTSTPIYMKIKYGNNLEETTDTQPSFENYKSNFFFFKEGECYPKFSVEVYDKDNNLLDSKNIDNTNN